MSEITLIAAIIAIVAAIFSPIITSSIQRKGNLEIKRLELVYDKKIQAYKEFSTTYGLLFRETTLVPYQNFCAAAQHAKLYADIKFGQDVDYLIRRIEDDLGITFEVEELYNNCLNLLNSDLKKSEYRK